MHGLPFFLLKWAGARIAIVSVEVCAYKLMPLDLAASEVAPSVYLFLLSLWLRAGDIFLKFAFWKMRGSNWLALESRALDVFEETESSMTPVRNPLNS